MSNVISTPDSDPFDGESLKTLTSLPRRGQSIDSLLTLLKLVARGIIGFGGIGCALFLIPMAKGGSEINDHLGKYVMGFAVSAAIAGIGALLQELANRLIFEKAPLGDLAVLMFDGIRRGEIEKVKVIAKGVIAQTERACAGSLPKTFVRAIAFDMLAELSDNDEHARQNAAKAVPLFRDCAELGLHTPLLHFLSATSLRIAGAKQDAITEYEVYLRLRPADDSARKIMQTLAEAPQT